MAGPPHDRAPLSRGLPPYYPGEARQQRIEGHVLIEFSVTPQGKPDQFTIVESEPPGVFDEAALSALRQFRYCTTHVEYPARMKVKMPFRLR